MLYSDRIDVLEGIDINKTNASKSVIFVTIGIFWKKGLNFKHMDAIDAMIY